jgi:hypothetical protein
MTTTLRRKFFVDTRVQGMLAYRVILYWFLFVSGMFILLAGFPVIVSFFVHSPGAPSAGQLIMQTWRTFWPAIFASALMLPLLILDIIRVSHRFAGPMYRLRSALRDMAAGKPVEPVVFRYGDFWCEVAEEFNQATAILRELQAKRKAEEQANSAAAKANETSIAL